MRRQLVEATVSLGTDGEAAIDVYQSPGDLRLYVLSEDGTARVDFVHRPGTDPQQSAAFFTALADHARLMATLVTTSDPVGHPAGSPVAAVA